MELNLFDARMLAPLVLFLEEAGSWSQRLLDRARIPGELVETGGWIGKNQAYDFTYDVVQGMGSSIDIGHWGGNRNSSRWNGLRNFWHG